MFSQTSEYAIRALSILARYPRDQYVLVGTLASNADLPHHYLSKILQNLVRMQILESAQGSRGGFRLARDPDEIILYEIVKRHREPGPDAPLPARSGRVFRRARLPAATSSGSIRPRST